MIPGPESRAKIDAAVREYTHAPSALLAVLHLLQQERGYIAPEDQVWAAGRHRVQFCRTLSCQLRGARDLLEHLKRRLGIREGEITTDGRFSLVAVECLGSCGTAPMMQVNDDYHESLT